MFQFSFKKSNSAVAYCALSIRCGTRNEDQRFGGLAHFTEHVLFKGTRYKTSNSINSYIEKLGGELNAFTTKEEIVIHSTVLKEDVAKAIGLLVELAFCSTFPEKEVEKEKCVVLDEIISYKDSPSEQIFDDFEEVLFDGTPLSMPVLGKTKTLKKIGVKQIMEFVGRYFIPDNMAFTVVADLQEEKVKGLLVKAMEKYASYTLTPQMLSADTTKNNVPDLLPQNPRFDKRINRKGHQTHCVIGGRAYSYYNPNRIALILLVNILGGPAANSRLNILLREKNALVYNVDAAYSQYSDAGMVTIYFGCDKDLYDKCVKLVMGELERFRTTLMSETALRSAKKQLLGQLAISSDNGEAQCLSMGKSLLVFKEILGQAKTRELVEAVTAQQIKDVASEIFDPERLSIMTYL